MTGKPTLFIIMWFWTEEPQPYDRSSTDRLKILTWFDLIRLMFPWRLSNRDDVMSGDCIIAGRITRRPTTPVGGRVKLVTFSSLQYTLCLYSAKRNPNQVRSVCVYPRWSEFWVRIARSRTFARVAEWKLKLTLTVSDCDHCEWVTPVQCH